MENLGKNFVSLSQAAKILGVHERTLWNWVRKDLDMIKTDKKDKTFKCPVYYQIGSRYKFHLRDLEEFMGESKKN